MDRYSAGMIDGWSGRRAALALGAAWLAALALGCRTTRDLEQPPLRTHEYLHSVLWIQTSAEYRATATQTFRLATLRLEQALADPEWTACLEQDEDFESLPPAIALDVDETLLDNSPFNARLVKSGTGFEPDLWEAWVRDAKAEAVPGSVAFAQRAAALGVRIYYLTNRNAEVEAFTQKNLAALGFPVDADGGNILSKNERSEWVWDKASRRRFIAREHRVILLAGDDLNDFVSGSQVEPKERVKLAQEMETHWGRDWILLPNPLYGGWQGALRDYEEDLPRSEVIRRVYKALDIFE